MYCPIQPLQGRWHLLFGHPVARVEVRDHHVGRKTATFRCSECRRDFEKMVPAAR